MKTVSFKTKVKEIWDGDIKKPFITFKKSITRSDCDFNYHEHTYGNSDLFLNMLNGSYKQAINNKEWSKLENLPESVQVDSSKFLATVTITLPESFWR